MKSCTPEERKEFEQMLTLGNIRKRALQQIRDDLEKELPGEHGKLIGSFLEHMAREEEQIKITELLCRIGLARDEKEALEAVEADAMMGRMR